MERLPGVWEVTGLISVRDSDLFFVLCSCHVDQLTFHKSSNSWLVHSSDYNNVIHYKHRSSEYIQQPLDMSHYTGNHADKHGQQNNT